MYNYGVFAFTPIEMSRKSDHINGQGVHRAPRQNEISLKIVYEESDCSLDFNYSNANTPFRYALYIGDNNSYEGTGIIGPDGSCKCFISNLPNGEYTLEVCIDNCTYIGTLEVFQNN